MGRDEAAALVGLQRDLQQIVGIEAEDGPAVGGDVADGGEALGGSGKILSMKRPP